MSEKPPAPTWQIRLDSSSRGHVPLPALHAATSVLSSATDAQRRAIAEHDAAVRASVAADERLKRATDAVIKADRDIAEAFSQYREVASGNARMLDRIKPPMHSAAWPTHPRQDHAGGGSCGACEPALAPATEKPLEIDVAKFLGRDEYRAPEPPDERVDTRPIGGAPADPDEITKVETPSGKARELGGAA